MNKQLCRLFMSIFLLASSSVSAANYVCGQDLNGNGEIDDSSEYQSCVKKDIETQSEPSVSCKEGFSLNGAHCEKITITTASPKCADGIYNVTTKLCEKTITASKEELCPPEYSLTNEHSCIKTISANKEPQCPNGTYNQNTKKCEQSTTIQKTPVCPSSFTLNERNQCVQTLTENFIPQCSIGVFNNATKKCENTSNIAISKSCPSGHVLNGGICERIDTINATPQCASGWSYASNQCQKEQTTNPIYGCPANFTYNSTYGVCRDKGRVTNGSDLGCRGLKAPSATEDGYHWSGTGGSGSGGMLCFFTVYTATNATKSCPSGTLSGNVCVLPPLTQAVTWLCPSEYTLSGSSCTKTTTAPVVMTCPSGWTQNGSTCYQTTISEPNWICPDGFTSVNNTCTKIITVEPSYVCPSSSMDTGSTCTTLNYFDPQWVCPTGYIENGNMCQQVITIDPSLVCPQNMNDMSAEYCSQIITSPPYYECPPAFIKDGMQCSLTEIADIIYTCQVGTILNTSTPTCLIGKYNYKYKICQISNGSTPASYGTCKNRPPESVTEGQYSERWDGGECVLYSEKYSTSAPIYAAKCIKNNAEYYCPIGANVDCLANNGSSNCSPNSCLDIDTDKPINEGSIDGSMLVDDGAKNSEGQCLDEMFIFNGRGQDCKLAGVSTAFKDCCKPTGSVLQDQAGSYMSAAQTLSTIKNIYGAAEKAYTAYNGAIAAGQTAGAAANAGAAAAQNYMVTAFDPTSLAISIAVYVVMEYIMQACDQTSMETAMLNDSGYCHYVGKYCAKRIKFIGCVQKAKAFCCFNSKLARIIHEQGRPQLSTGINTWGTPEKPLCRGFTPEEFQSVDFGQIDLSEYIDEVQKNAQDQIQQNMKNVTSSFIEDTH